MIAPCQFARSDVHPSISCYQGNGTRSVRLANDLITQQGWPQKLVLGYMMMNIRYVSGSQIKSQGIINIAVASFLPKPGAAPVSSVLLTTPERWRGRERFGPVDRAVDSWTGKRSLRQSDGCHRASWTVTDLPARGR